ncbi:DUF4982 domain-containing protein [Mucilaginibacter terrenus]|uniref:DUF4982 domain-containing protein n=1 Tax=Mucilaginibacter terrenus TaxID=2482727 RepID=A0A3E2NK27_9SPHI|nr:glycoside hydrolase family 2 TIM barrel-domain containing protein [Mucilaginibacter terrenus]RFZ81349.1 DUF4982 domain-containing protein [Mucilaginibacter terrenus]
MKKLAAIFSLLIAFVAQLNSAQAQRTIINLDKGWQFAKGAYGSPSEKASTVSLPHTWNAKDVMDDEPGYYRGPAVYTKQVLIPAADKGGQVYLYINGANQVADIYLNGEKIAAHNGGYTRFNVNLGKYLKYGQQNELAIAVDNAYNENIPPLTADFTFFGGLYRDVYLVKTNTTHFNTDFAADGVFISTPNVSAEKAILKVTGKVTSVQKSKLLLSTVVLDKTGKKVAQKSVEIEGNGSENSFETELPEIAAPHLWTPEHPYLYRVVSTITDAKTGKVLDKVTEPLGLRWYKFDGEKGFFLNGKPYKLMGVSRHQDFEGLGNALTAKYHVHDVAMIKKMGGNFLRVAHYPQDKKVLDACDSLGILASVEIPVVNAITETPEFTQNSKNMLMEMIKQNFNHPSIVIWAYMNEVLLRPKYGNDKPRQQEYFKNVRLLAALLDSIARKEDPARYTMIACHGDYNRYKQAGIVDVPMLIGWNLYQGWYSGKTEDFGKFLDKFHGDYPKLPMLITEYGADADSRIRSLTPERFDKSIDYAVDFHKVYLDAIMTRPFVSAGIIWNLADFSSEERAETTPHINSKGLLTQNRSPKDVYFLYQANLLKTPFLKISNWNNRAGLADSLTPRTSTQLVRVFTNQKSVSLKLNGKTLGTKTTENGIISWSVPFVNGVNQLTATSPSGGKAIRDDVAVKFNLLPANLKQQSSKALNINVLLGSKRFFYSSAGTEWMPAPIYTKGGFGYTGGTPFKLPGNGRVGYGTDRNINKTSDDPIYQTQQVGIKSFKMNVPDGNYQLTLHFAELTTDKQTEALAYNLDNADKGTRLEDRVFTVEVNGRAVLQNFSIAGKYGPLTAGAEKFTVIASDGKGINIVFVPVKGEPVLNAIQLTAR